jgi:hypothetical protein
MDKFINNNPIVIHVWIKMSKYSNIKIPKDLAEKARKKLESETTYRSLPEYVSAVLRKFIGENFLNNGNEEAEA